MNTAELLEVITKISNKIDENKEYLTQLDNEIADGDHGINLARGFKEVEKKLPLLTEKDAGDILKTVGMTLVSTVGGASGPLYGTFFMRLGMGLAGKKEISYADFVKAFEMGVEGVKQRGKSVYGEKTMLDSMIPCLEAMKATDDAKTGFETGLAKAKEGIEFTKTIAATKGRASYIAERSIGHADPGATSFTMMLECVL